MLTVDRVDAPLEKKYIKSREKYFKISLTKLKGLSFYLNKKMNFFIR